MSHPFKHFMTITHHRHLVIAHCFRAGIPLRGLLHDLSKYAPVEFVPGAKYWRGNCSPNVGEREATGVSRAWLHHKGRNKHHFEYWTDYVPAAHGMAGVPMPDKCIIEMFCDRVAASKTYLGADYTDAAPLEYYERMKCHYLIHPQTAQKLHRLLRMLAERGERETFATIRRERRAADR